MKNECTLRLLAKKDNNIKYALEEVDYLRKKLIETRKDVSALYNALDSSALTKDVVDWFEVLLEDIDFLQHDNCEGCCRGCYTPQTYDSPADFDCGCKDAINIDLPNGKSYCDSYYESTDEY